jgi:hypothetical protein
MGQAPRADFWKNQFARTDDNLIPFFFVFLNVNTRLLRLPRMRIKAFALPPVNFHIQRFPCLIDKVVAILDEQPDLFIGAPCILAREVHIHHRHRL